MNFFLTMLTMRSISFGAMGLVQPCSLSRFTTWAVNSEHACRKGWNEKFWLQKFDDKVIKIFTVITAHSVEMADQLIRSK